ncbi:hypothetical protein YPPY66_5146 [Yersinia pestis PY-66]|uniref:Uncharacterized protein n=2 Tax=Yersinia pestis TaxID=632 RepID=A0AAV3B5W6_YERPE|nr:hypothetical protein YPIP275_4696 [Yersinia pestis biovar Orientalis str. IP275]EDR41199.1 hypothetical protein YpE1979001_0785 [Yersinia pestis biovar Antiqua str. E1979001]EDR48680.1 hypothetical protein YpB42003004_0385 [Yersinia pestis biovar Antiqua str. B42003004]EDR55094.1 hypothetical protein YpMG051020_2813 [Yersinia pestis biovar Orientalis str. MG05-1020]EIQ95588.1 hypothetical protein YPPY01_4832 [Yersinia pestis PY-01]EIQ96418.1 hypothetical protein YPPY02_4758 [Yersinia pestis
MSFAVYVFFSARPLDDKNMRAKQNNFEIIPPPILFLHK